MRSVALGNSKRRSDDYDYDAAADYDYAAADYDYDAAADYDYAAADYDYDAAADYDYDAAADYDYDAAADYDHDAAADYDYDAAADYDHDGTADHLRSRYPGPRDPGVSSGECPGESGHSGDSAVHRHLDWFDGSVGSSDGRGRLATSSGGSPER